MHVELKNVSWHFQRYCSSMSHELWSYHHFVNVCPTLLQIDSLHSYPLFSRDAVGSLNYCGCSVTFKHTQTANLCQLFNSTPETIISNLLMTSTSSYCSLSLGHLSPATAILNWALRLPFQRGERVYFTQSTLPRWGIHMHLTGRDEAITRKIGTSESLQLLKFGIKSIFTVNRQGRRFERTLPLRANDARNVSLDMLSLQGGNLTLFNLFDTIF